MSWGIRPLEGVTHEALEALVLGAALGHRAAGVFGACLVQHGTAFAHSRFAPSGS